MGELGEFASFPPGRGAAGGQPASQGPNELAPSWGNLANSPNPPNSPRGDAPETSGGGLTPPGLESQGGSTPPTSLFYGPNELAANCAPAMVETALRSAETKLSTEKLPPGSRGVVATSRRLAQS